MPERWRLFMLLIASYFFYMSWKPVFILLILPMTIFNWVLGKSLYRSPRLLLGIGISINLFVLSIFKYANFFVQSMTSLVGVVTVHSPEWMMNIMLPLGISFFTFEFIHYLFEIYRGQKPIDSFVTFALFVTFFPTQIAGPIKRFPDFLAQLKINQKLSLTYFDEGIPLIVIGLAKKLLLADNLATFVRMGISDPLSFGALELWLFMYAFAFQIYFDFSGYTDIARGSALLFGYRIPVNFNMPYVANNVVDFWRRWHISLSTWLRDYLYIPLGGSKYGKWITNRNLLITMVLGGLWHGAAWNFVIWGIYHGVCLIIHREFVQWRDSINILKVLCKSRVYNFCAIFITFHIICIGWVFFCVQNQHIAFGMVKRMILLSPIFSRVENHQWLVCDPLLPVIVPVVMTMIIGLLVTNFAFSAMLEKRFLEKLPAFFKAAFCSFLVIAIVTFSPDNSKPFIYFQF